MMFSSLTRLSGLAVLSLALTQCQVGPDGRPDVVNPTVDQMDALDQQWGLPKRVTKGSGKRYVNAPPPLASDSDSDSSSSEKPEKKADSSSSEAKPAEPASDGNKVDPSVINNLR